MFTKHHTIVLWPEASLGGPPRVTPSRGMTPQLPPRVSPTLVTPLVAVSQILDFNSTVVFFMFADDLTT